METELEYVLTNTYKAGMISYVSTHPECFEEIVNLTIADKKPYSWRAAWLLWSCMEKNDRRILEYIPVIIDILLKRSENHQRELLIILQKMDIPEEHQGLLLDSCVTIWTSIHKKPSIRYNAFKIIALLAKKHPDLKHEMTLLTQDLYVDSLSTAVRKSIAKMVK